LLFSEVENSPCVIGESLSCGIPVISSNVGGIPELVDDSNSMLIQPGDEQALLSSMEAMMKNKHLYNKDVIAQQAAAKFSYPVIGRRMDLFYQAILSGN
jgi:glycosyltransferase involved in cell wall biosynthesis